MYVLFLGAYLELILLYERFNNFSQSLMFLLMLVLFIIKDYKPLLTSAVIIEIFF